MFPHNIAGRSMIAPTILIIRLLDKLEFGGESPLTMRYELQ